MKKVKLNVNRLFRGGYWLNSASYLRATSRIYGKMPYQYWFIGPRLVRGKR